MCDFLVVLAGLSKSNFFKFEQKRIANAYNIKYIYYVESNFFKFAVQHIISLHQMKMYVMMSPMKLIICCRFFPTKGGFYLLKMEHQEDAKHNEHTPGLSIVRMHIANINSYTRVKTPATRKVI